MTSMNKLAPKLIDKVITEVLERSKSRETLLALSLTSRAINDRANIFIWRSIPDLQPLLNCMPTDVWNPNEQKVSLTLVTTGRRSTSSPPSKPFSLVHARNHSVRLVNVPKILSPSSTLWSTSRPTRFCRIQWIQHRRYP
jgi:hypothetical protein